MKNLTPGALLAFLLLAGCAHQPEQMPIGDWSERQAQLDKLNHWQVTGKLGVRIPGDNGSANLRWRQENKHYNIDLSGPLGSGRVAISGQPGQVNMQQAGEQPLSATTAEELILYSTGWTIPVAQLVYWVRALPAPEQKVTHWEKNELDQITLLEQAGWRVQYSQYQPVSTGVTISGTTSGSNAGEQQYILLPGRVIAEYGDVRLTLVIREWLLEDGKEEGKKETKREKGKLP